jgi:glycosyltransferase involved in cell wall biosynthesis
MRSHLSIGLPVFNGENYLAGALESLLAQTYGDFEIVISDNASTDGTEEICRAYQALDPRVRYYRSGRNLGSARNFNQVFELSSGEYFKWAAHDDLCAPEYLERCVEVLDRDHSVVLCHARARVIDERGRKVEDYEALLNTDSPRPRDRFHDLILVKNRCYEANGVTRAEVLRATRLMGNYPVADRILLAELALRGRFYEVPEYLFFPRSHPAQSVQSLPTQHLRAIWFDPGKAGRIVFPEWRTFLEYCRAIHRAPVAPAERVWCYLYMVQWVRHYRKRLRGDLAIALGQLMRGCREARPRTGKEQGAAAGRASGKHENKDARRAVR